jgi:hypothetical protein
MSDFKCRRFPTDIILGRQGSVMRPVILHLPLACTRTRGLPHLCRRPQRPLPTFKLDMETIYAGLALFGKSRFKGLGRKQAPWPGDRKLQGESSLAASSVWGDKSLRVQIAAR